MVDTRVSTKTSNSGILRIRNRDDTIRSIIECKPKNGTLVGGSNSAHSSVADCILAVGSGFGQVNFIDLRAGRYLPQQGSISDVGLLNSPTRHHQSHGRADFQSSVRDGGSNVNLGFDTELTDDVVSQTGSEYTIQSSEDGRGDWYGTLPSDEVYTPGWLHNETQASRQRYIYNQVGMNRIAQKSSFAVFTMAWRPTVTSTVHDFSGLDFNSVNRGGIKIAPNRAFRSDGSLFVGGGPIVAGIQGSYAALW